MTTAVSSVVLWLLAGLYGILIIATMALLVLKRFCPEEDYTELKLRVQTWWLIVTLFAVAITLSRKVSLVFFAFISFLALKEYFSLIPTRRSDRRVLFWAYWSIPIQYFFVHQEWYGMFLIFIPVYMFLLLPMRMVVIGETKDFLRAVGTLNWGLMTTVFSISHVAYLLVLPQAVSPAGGPGLVLFLVLLTQLNDVAQYLWGKSLGRHKVVPKISPNKTREGLLGGLATTMLLSALLAPWLTPMNFVMALLAGLIIGLGGFVGDVIISALKRDLGVKDSGSLLPGHGGVLDRIDSLIYTAPLFFHFIYYFYY
jgi:phosphatidate cytidylyltransferase